MVNGLEVHGVQGDHTGSGVVKALHQVDDGGLASPAGPHQRHFASRWDVQVHILQHLPNTQRVTLRSRKCKLTFFSTCPTPSMSRREQGSVGCVSSQSSAAAQRPARPGGMCTLTFFSTCTEISLSHREQDPAGCVSSHAAAPAHRLACHVEQRPGTICWRF